MSYQSSLICFIILSKNHFYSGEITIYILYAPSNYSNYQLSDCCGLQKRTISSSTTIKLNQFHNSEFVLRDNNFNSEATKP